jgi:hypothetical protein
MDGIQTVNELNEYLSKPLEKVRDPIDWWWEHKTSYPKLSKMALDYLSVPRESLITVSSTLCDIL